MPSHKRRTAAATRKPKADDRVNGTLKAVHQALRLQSARVAKLQVLVDELTHGLGSLPIDPRRDPPTDTEIYWRRRR
jgi:hypothetical protein